MLGFYKEASNKEKLAEDVVMFLTQMLSDTEVSTGVTTVGCGKIEDWKGCTVGDMVTANQSKFGTIWARDFICGG